MPPTVHLRCPRRDERGTTAAEYALLLALICVALMSGVTLFGQKINVGNTKIGDHIITNVSRGIGRAP